MKSFRMVVLVVLALSVLAVPSLADTETQSTGNEKLTITVKSIRGNSEFCEASFRLSNGEPGFFYVNRLTSVNDFINMANARGSRSESGLRVDREAWITRNSDFPYLLESDYSTIVLESTQITVRDRCTP